MSKASEQTYGWYPSANNAWYHKNEPSSYEKECLYKHWKSRYTDKPFTPATPTLMYPTPASRQGVSRQSVSRQAKRQSTQDTAAGLHVAGACPPTSSGTRRLSSSHKKAAAERRVAWSERLAPTRIFVPPYISRCPYGTEPGANPRLSIDSANLLGSPTPATPARKQKDTERPRAPVRRAQSANQQRARASLPQRPVKSARDRKLSLEVTRAEPAPPPREEPGKARHQHGDSPAALVLSGKPSPPSSPVSPRPTPDGLRRPKAPSPPNLDKVDVEVEVEPEKDDSVDYNEQLDKYGWRFEVPGDPYGLKKSCLPYRAPYTLTVPLPTVAPNPPTGMMVNYKTCFTNTIPRHQTTFTVHQEWISEVLSAKRYAMQKNHPVTYNHKKFAFIY